MNLQCYSKKIVHLAKGIYLFMSKVVVPPHYLDALTELNRAIEDLNEQKITLLLELLGIKPTDVEWEKMLVWDLILVTVLDKQMAVQLNKLSAYVPRLKFVVRTDLSLFTLMPGTKRRRVWKER